jgi:hypothetical protein
MNTFVPSASNSSSENKNIEQKIRRQKQSQELDSVKVNLAERLEQARAKKQPRVLTNKEKIVRHEADKAKNWERYEFARDGQEDRQYVEPIMPSNQGIRHMREPLY